MEHSDEGCRIHDSRTSVLAPDDTLTTAIALMDAGDFHTVPVIRSGKLVGIIDRDIRKNDSVTEAVRMLISYTGNAMFLKNREREQRSRVV
jgi:CBS domain-containing protein